MKSLYSLSIQASTDQRKFLVIRWQKTNASRRIPGHIRELARAKWLSQSDTWDLKLSEMKDFT